MYINRIAVARILGVKINSIRKAYKKDITICVEIWGSKEKVYNITLEQYYSFVEELKKDPKFEALKSNENTRGIQNFEAPKSNENTRGNQSGFGILLMIIGGMILISGYMKDTSISTRYGSVSNISLMNEQQNQIQIGGISFIAGVLLYCLDKK
ncbi:MAG: hypothetical protein NWQ43_06050 [Dolichospermum sp.]|nr:hypothetical protein [Dolichospermum sp.]